MPRHIIPHKPCNGCNRTMFRYGTHCNVCLAAIARGYRPRVLVEAERQRAQAEQERREYDSKLGADSKRGATDAPIAYAGVNPYGDSADD